MKDDLNRHSQKVWRDKQAELGLKALTVWLDTDDWLVLEDLLERADLTMERQRGLAAVISKGIHAISDEDLKDFKYTSDKEAIINEAKKLRETGLSWGAIAKKWNDDGRPTLTRRGLWKGSNISRLCKLQT